MACGREGRLQGTKVCRGDPSPPAPLPRGEGGRARGNVDGLGGLGGGVGGEDGGEGVPVVAGFVFGGAAGAEGFDEVALGLGEAVLVGAGAGEIGAGAGAGAPSKEPVGSLCRPRRGAWDRGRLIG